eukprot:CAMPEP_0197272236 /NCGR_PEP_ID=MMETSP1432-20130617/9683_1 /TAXON_ID=44447 /ORGANISM="Pseudo-nitzschia delicatissima, Strain UNC1205" /LENGTH=141 /DNA_ID=CAMNT_0042737771 /DNA_START=101 /DNA_END=526 /DNA_ORIENTATION=-
MSCTNSLLLFAIGEERVFESFAFEATGQTVVLVVDHVIVHAYRVVAIDITFFHHLVDRTKNLKNTSCIPGKAIDDILQFVAVEFPVLVHVKMLSGATDDEFSGGTVGILLDNLSNNLLGFSYNIGIGAFSFLRGARFGADR